ncbi:MAG: class IV adenylate cyclase [Clostridiales bacterium]|nr:class IV adenylate cyclase [Clostridiales bacterium]
MVEIEVKIRLDDLEKTKAALLKLGAKIEKERFLEENTLYDLSSQTLRQKRCALRFRKVQNKAFLTFKGAPQKSRRFKVREEFETEVKNEKHLRKILRSLGFFPVFSYQKFRTVYRKGRLKVCLDETEAGNFLEVEGEKSDIAKFVRCLGFSRADLIKKDYVELFCEQKSAP